MVNETITNFEEYINITHKLQRRWKFAWFRGVDRAEYEPQPGLFWRKFESAESALVHDFLVSYKSIVGSKAMSSWELYFLMQHHGLPTRLLDWTKSPLIALYFALEKAPNFNGRRAVWVMDPSQLNGLSIKCEECIYCPSEWRSKTIDITEETKLNLDSYLPGALDETDAEEYPGFPLAIEPPLSNSRILAQSGCFTIHGNGKNTITNIFSSVNSRKRKFGRLFIEGKKLRRDMLEHLYSMGIKEDNIYQDLYSLSKRVIREIGLCPTSS